MKIILSPAKKMNIDTDTLPVSGTPQFLEKSETILDWLRSQSAEVLQKLWGCSDKLAQQNFDRLDHMDLRSQLIPSSLSISSKSQGRNS